MALILNIETSTKNCSVGLAKDGECIYLKEENKGDYSHAEKLHIFIEEALKSENLKAKDLDAIAVGKGPGSYTGLRIGVSTAKGLAYAINKPLISVDTLKALAKNIQVKQGIIVPMIDARRLEVYSAIFNLNHEYVRGPEAEIIDEHSYQSLLAENPVYFLGDGALKCKGIIQHTNANFIDNKFPSAQEMAFLAEEKYQEKHFEDTAYFEPFYLKDFMVTPQKK
ncbi:tRNA (adenosine(37)-N6)-threonylcarbamoyltransferase complex dimerization subunit type 1 TsaB [Wenyingzhuangia sp. chi5]|uniref:tRNA (Adenosine(37)-N6)-threonylcarbamoyltransferase complex dimerization subunit type 1 TsaB n=1 Tax=Wenyingzhuangia gilva TaxID=3057677 RepID=A0ABT8VNZ5_9FLAO|nr:tRNA (adenosine(37)-N6)-threonylcarbamoyltransferase complex dimerization subunit type 1 TsaB [Wenyingzhuangia sp. chi5]MDO3693695.1 tRNA (adenosine(37)-N6)-threonylcarbamoyltransferase complex dimerization subunit type 1 TsaB [Wenyingzhuangia sp. chi5]